MQHPRRLLMVTQNEGSNERAQQLPGLPKYKFVFYSRFLYRLFLYPLIHWAKVLMRFGPLLKRRWSLTMLFNSNGGRIPAGVGAQEISLENKSLKGKAILRHATIIFWGGRTSNQFPQSRNSSNFVCFRKNVAHLQTHAGGIVRSSPAKAPNLWGRSDQARSTFDEMILPQHAAVPCSRTSLSQSPCGNDIRATPPGPSGHKTVPSSLLAPCLLRIAELEVATLG